jgi:serine/threonine protein kinase
MLGKTIGKYRVVEKIGRGGMGTVYKAIDETLDREVAVKVLNPDLGESAIVRRFRAEAMTLARLNHPGIATIYELFRSDDDLLMVMEFVRGETFDCMVERLGPLEPERAASLGAQVLDALGHAHRLGIVHRDLKPANLMLSEYGAVKIMDFGIARVVGTEHLTSDGLMMGTPAYMAPEQVLATDVDGRADLYSVGVVIYRLLSGNLPFSADTAIAMAHKQLKDPPTPLRQYRSELPPWCEDVLWRALAKSPADRFQTAEEFRDALLGCGGSLVPMALPGSLETTLPPDHPVALIDRPAEPAPVHQFNKGRSNGSPALSADAAGDAAFAATVPVATPAGVRVVSTPIRDPSPVLAAPHPSSNPGAEPLPGTPAATREPTTVILKPRHLAVAAGLFGTLVVTISGLALLVVRRPDAAPATSATSAAPAPATSPPSSAATSPARPTEHAPAAATETIPPARPATARDATLPPLTIVDIRFVAAEGTRVRERDAIMTFSSGVLTISERNGAVLRSIPYEQIRSVNYSRSRQPMWKSPRGPAPVMRVGGGAFGIFRSDPHWVSIRTKEAFSVLRVAPEHLRTLPAAFSHRTGVTMDRVRAPAR